MPKDSPLWSVSRDNGKTWSDSSEGKPLPTVTQDGTGHFIAGAHAGVVEISDGRLMALGRDGTGKKRDINRKMPKSISSDWGKTWTYTASPFPPISSGQRLVLMRLREGPILFVSFTSMMHGKQTHTSTSEDGKPIEVKGKWGKGMTFRDDRGHDFTGYGMFAALSYDEGETWPVRKLLTPGSGHYEKCGGWTGNYTATPTRAEPGGYLSATQTPDGVIHLISSAWHYRFNLAWLKTPNEAAKNNKENMRMKKSIYTLPLILVVAFAATAIAGEESEVMGETLYNGIVLPKEWPPKDRDPANLEPMPVPYLTNRPEVVPIDVGRQLFVDDFLIEKANLKRTYHLPEKYKGNPVLKPETKWEIGWMNGAVPKQGGCWWDPDAELFRFWYGYNFQGGLAMVVSKDGLTWERPAFDVKAKTNIVLEPEGGLGATSVARNWWSKDPDRKWLLSRKRGHKTGEVYTSADGIHWKNKTVTGQFGDMMSIFYNPFRKKWVFSLKKRFGELRGKDFGGKRSRCYHEHDGILDGARTTAEMVPWVWADKLDKPDPKVGDPCQLYSVDAVAYESLMLGLFQVHRGPNNGECGKVGLPKLTELNFAYSRDGFHWHRPDRRAHIPAERQDVWDRAYLRSLGNVCVIMKDKLYFYYGAHRGTGEPGYQNQYKNGATGLAILRRDGFASMDAGHEVGTLTTRPVTFSGKHLFVNVDCADGEIRAEVLDSDGNPIDPFTLANAVGLQTDSTLARMAWTGGADLSALAGKQVRFRFHLLAGSLYSFWVSQDESGRSDGYVAGGGPGYSGPTDTVGRTVLE